MKQKFAQLVEWAWSNDLLSNEESQLYFVQILFLSLQCKFPQSRGVEFRGIEEIKKDFYRCLKKLNYGGRTPSEMPQLRKEFLNSLSLHFFAVDNTLQLHLRNFSNPHI
jgi:hypothetical protein